MCKQKCFAGQEHTQVPMCLLGFIVYTVSAGIIYGHQSGMFDARQLALDGAGVQGLPVDSQCICSALEILDRLAVIRGGVNYNLCGLSRMRLKLV
eukprot:scaffold171785_cov17-Prasinocladus_malaysianus.AAC.1